MAINVIGGSSSSAGKTDEGGTIVLSEYKVAENIYITTSKLAAGTYYLTTQGNGSFSVYAYTGTSVGEKLADATVSSVRITNTVVVPSGITGIIVSGSYVGSLVFQSITQSSAVTSITSSFALSTTLRDYGSNNAWTPIGGQDKFIITRSFDGNYGTTYGKPSILNTYTGVEVTSSNQIVTSSTVRTYFPGVATNGSNIFVGSGGYTGNNANDSAISSSIDGGATWSAVKTTFGMDYHNQVMYGGGLFIVASSSNGWSQAVTTYYTSTDGVNWTTRTFPASNYGQQLRYLGGVWIWFYPSNSNTIYTSTDGITWTTRTVQNISQWTTIWYSNGKWAFSNGNGDWYTTTDFISYSYLTSSAAYRTYGDNYSDTYKAMATYQGYTFGPGTYNDGSMFYDVIIYFTGTGVNQMAVYQGPNLSWRGTMLKYPFVLNGSLYAYSNSGSNWYKTSIGSSSATYAYPLPKDSTFDAYYFSKKFNYWYASSTGSNSYGLYKANVSGRNGFTSGFTQVVNTGVATYKAFDTANGIGCFVAGTYYYSTDGTNFSGSSASTSQPQYGSGYYNGAILCGSSTQNQFVVSFDNGITFANMSATTGSAETLYVQVLSSSVMLWGPTSKKLFRFNGEAVVDAGITLSGTGAPQKYPVNECVINNSGTVSTWYKTTKGATISNIQFTTPSLGTIVQFGTLFALVTSGANFWTSTSCLTWTARTYPNNKSWNSFSGSDSNLFIGSSTDSQTDILTVQMTVTI